MVRQVWLIFVEIFFLGILDWYGIWRYEYGSGALFLRALNSVSIFDLLLKREGARYVPFQQLLVAMADTLPSGSVVLNANITQVDYGSSDDSTISYTVDGTAKSTLCSSTIIAFPQTFASHGGALHSSERHWFIGAPCESQDYQLFYTIVGWSDNKFGGSRTKGADYLIPFDEIPDNPAVNMILNEQQDSLNSSIVAYYLSPTEKTDEEAQSESLNHYEKIIGSAVDESIVQDFNRWDYFPHVSKEDLEDGFYEEFDSYQGQDDQYYVGGLFNFEMVQAAMQHGEHIIEKFFWNIKRGRIIGHLR
jgi:hypothetical protein